MFDSCSLEKQPLLTLLEALHRIKNLIIPVHEIETVSICQALGRVLAKTVSAPMNSPQHRNAAMDGYAFNSERYNTDAFHLKVIGTAYAGKPYKQTLSAGQCIRIFTGAIVPDSLDSVVMQERVNINADTVYFPANTAFKQNIRDIGEDILQGECLLHHNKKLTAVDIGLLASVGISQVRVKRRIRIAIFSTGDELVPLEQPLMSGQIHDSNRYLISALLNDPCYQLYDGGIIADDIQQLKTSFLQAAETHDVIISTGGASVGDADYVRALLQQHGDIYFWKLAIKPGKPFAFGKLNNSYFLGLPGNPVAVIATLQQLVTPALQQLSGGELTNPLRIQATCTDNLKKSIGRQEFQRGILMQDAQGEFYVRSAGLQGSHLLVSMSRANCFIVLPSECAGIQAGERVIVEPFAINI